MKGYGSIVGPRWQQAGGCGRLGIGLAFLASLFGLLGISAPSAEAASMGITGYFGNPGTAPETIGGRFGSGGPRGIAVRDSSGDIYVVDTINNRVQRFDDECNFVSVWGRDVVSSGGFGDTNEK